MIPLSLLWLLISAHDFVPQESVLNSARARYNELLRAAPREDLTWLVPKLEALANESPLSPCTPAVLETIHAIGLLHPGSVPDQDAGLLVSKPAAAPAISATLFAPMRGRLVRTDRRGYIWVLAADQRSIQILSRDGKVLLSLAPTVPSGKEPSIEYFALDALNHAYILDSTSSSIQVFAVNEAGDSLDKKRVASVPLDPRPYTKNLRVLAVSTTGEIVATGKNDDYWVSYR